MRISVPDLLNTAVHFELHCSRYVFDRIKNKLVYEMSPFVMCEIIMWLIF